MTRVLVCGGRDYSRADHVWDVLDKIHHDKPIDQIIQGGATGADGAARGWAMSRGVTCTTVLADWDKQGKAAGPIRNQRMLDEHNPDMVVAFPGGRGTADMVRRARVAGIPVRKGTQREQGAKR